jgi:hypothetical protein
MLSNSPRLKQKRHWNRWNAFHRWLQVSGEFPNIKIGAAGSTKEDIRKQYQELSGDKLEAFQAFYDKLLADDQPVGLPQASKAHGWKRVLGDINRAVGQVELLGGHCFAMVVKDDWCSRGQVFGTQKGVSWAKNLNELQLGHTQFTHYVRNQHLSEYMLGLQAFKQEYDISTLPSSTKRSRLPQTDLQSDELKASYIE